MQLARRFQPPLKYSTLTLKYWLAGLFLIINLFYYFLGVRFDYTPIYYFAQFIDTNLLKSNLFESLFYLHSQPPLFNFFLGVILNFFPDNLQLVFSLIYLGCGLLFTIVFFSLMVKLGTRPLLAFIATAIFIASPAFILYENWIYSTLFEILFLCLSALFLYQFIERNSLKSGIAFFSVLALLVLLRSSFHLLWFAGVVCFIIVMNRSNWRRILIASAIPFLIILALYGKNFLLFGSFSSSSWIGMNLAEVALPAAPPQNLNELIQSGAISPIVKIPRLKDLDYYKQVIPIAAKTGIPVLDQEYKYVPLAVLEYTQTTSAGNFNNLNYINISNQYLRADLYFMLHQPLSTISKVAEGTIISFIPASHYWLFSLENLNSIRPIDGLYTFLIDGDILQPLINSKSPIWFQNSVFDISWFILARFIISILFGVKLILNTKNNKSSKPFTITIFFLVSTIIYYTLVSNLFDFGENNRFRFDIDPFCIIIFILFLQNVLLRFSKRLPENVQASKA
jgi:hypothetical protein